MTNYEIIMAMDSKDLAAFLFKWEVISITKGLQCDQMLNALDMRFFLESTDTHLMQTLMSSEWAERGIDFRPYILSSKKDIELEDGQNND